MTNKTIKTPKAATDSRPAPSKLDQLLALLRQSEGATIVDMVAATGWQTHSVRGAMAGALKKRGHIVTSEKSDGARRYHIVPSA